MKNHIILTSITLAILMCITTAAHTIVRLNIPDYNSMRQGTSYSVTIKEAIMSAYQDNPEIELINQELVRMHNNLNMNTEARSVGDTVDSMLAQYEIVRLEHEKQQVYDRIKKDVVNAYYDILLANSYIALCQQRLIFVQRELSKARENYSIGRADSLTVELWQQRHDSAMVGIQNAQNRYEIAINSLLLLMNLELDNNLFLVDAVGENYIPIVVEERYFEGEFGGIPQIINVMRVRSDIDYFRDLENVLRNHRDIILANESLYLHERLLNAYTDSGAHQSRIIDAQADYDEAAVRLDVAERNIRASLWEKYVAIVDAYNSLTEARADLEVANAVYSQYAYQYEIGMLQEVDYNRARLGIYEAQYNLQVMCKDYAMAYLNYDIFRKHHTLFYPPIQSLSDY